MIALLGHGTVGKGVVEILQKYPKLTLKKILVRDLAKADNLKLANLMTLDINDILNDDDITIILDCTGADIAYRWIKTALQKGKHVVTSNKKLVSQHLEELTNLAEQNGVAFLYEAAVGGGIPLLKSLRDYCIWNDIWQVEGVLNGTSNYILTKMQAQSYQAALQQAQQLGYAESDPTADVGGYDTRRKLRIVASMAFGAKISEDNIVLRGIEQLAQQDLSDMAELGYAVKLLARAWRKADGLAAYVFPAAVPKTRALAYLEGTENAGIIYGDAAGPLAFYGYGAGKLPTAYAMLLDAWDIFQGKWSNCLIKDQLMPLKPFRAKFYYRIVDQADGAWLKLATQKMANGYVSNWVKPAVFDDFNGPLILLEVENEI